MVLANGAVDWCLGRFTDGIDKYSYAVERDPRLLDDKYLEVRAACMFLYFFIIFFFWVAFEGFGGLIEPSTIGLPPHTPPQPRLPPKSKHSGSGTGRPP